MVRGRSILIRAALGGAVFVAISGVVAVACAPNLDDTVSVLGATPTVLAVNANPAEAPAQSPVTYTALVADSVGQVSGDSLQWDYCNARNPLRNLGPVNTSCVEPGGGPFVFIGNGAHVGGAAAEVPSLACANFGPNPPPVQDGSVDGSVGRPVDPDTTGGYYQPVSVFLPGGAPEVTLYPMRVSCGFSGATQTASAVLKAQYHLNVNPEVLSLTVVQDDASGMALMPDTTPGTAISVSAGQALTFRVAWPACPLVDVCGDGVCGANEAVTELGDAGVGTINCPGDCSPPPSCASFTLDAGPEEDAGTLNCVPPLYAAGQGVSCPNDCEGLVGGCPAGCEIPAGCPADCKNPRGCAGAERYVNLDLTTENAVYQREGIHVSWYATAGTFDNDRTGRDGTDDATTSDNGWTAPEAPGPVHLWVVLRDDRYGVGWAGYAIDVTK
jgi:hypothetical protein